MNPFEFLSLTPKSNCGECGHPTCLAFSVAVTKGGADPKGCRHVDPSTLPPELEPSPPGDEHEPSARQTDLALVEHLKGKIAELDFEMRAPSVGAQWNLTDPDLLVFKYLDYEVHLRKNGITIDGEDVDDPRDSILLYNYIFYGGSEEVEPVWVGMESLPNSISKVTTLATYCEKILARRFSGRAQKLSAICRKLGAAPADAEQSASVAGIIFVLPRIPIYLLFWDEAKEEGFEAKVKVLFDRRVLQILDLESLVFTAERMAERMVDLDNL
ncbi:MAG: DUF3786 domain-containing protein [Desulfobulbaceae bacterium]|nr:DUF3786 domain-containing protein [Desulfobulbaceae bacterium]